MKVLIADSSLVARNLLESTLRGWGFDVVLAIDGVEAWKVLTSDDAVCMMIVEAMMPGMTGPELCQAVRRELDPVRYVYIIMLTSKSRREDLIQGMEAGADDYLTKPFDQHELKVRLWAGQRILKRIASAEAGPSQHSRRRAD